MAERDGAFSIVLRPGPTEVQADSVISDPANIIRKAHDKGAAARAFAACRAAADAGFDILLEEVIADIMKRNSIKNFLYHGIDSPLS